MTTWRDDSDVQRFLDNVIDDAKALRGMEVAVAARDRELDSKIQKMLIDAERELGPYAPAYRRVLALIEQDSAV